MDFGYVNICIFLSLQRNYLTINLKGQINDITFRTSIEKVESQNRLLKGIIYLKLGTDLLYQ